MASYGADGTYSDEQNNDYLYSQQGYQYNSFDPSQEQYLPTYDSTYPYDPNFQHPTSSDYDPEVLNYGQNSDPNWFPNGQYDASTPTVSTSYSTEQQIVDNFQHAEINPPAPSKSSLFRVFMIVAVAAIIIVGAAFTTTRFSNSDTNVIMKSISYDDMYYDIAITNADYGIPPSQAMLPWDFLVEPYREQTVSINVDDSNYDIEWNMAGVTYTGSSAVVTFDKVGIYQCTVTVSDTAAASVNTSTFSVAVKYIRREIRSLTDADRTKFFNTLQMLYQVDQTTGESLYGSKYRSAEYLLHKHLNGAGRTDCDHWHDGAGIITHHAAFTLECEQSLQSIDPSISMPYWEYTVDSEIYDNYNWVSSPIFNDDWFGEASPNNDDHIISKGIWAGVGLPSGASYTDWSVSGESSLNPFVNGYGLLRSPWNNNPSPYIGRHNASYSSYSSLTALGRCSCSAMSECYASGTLGEMNDCLNGYTHGVIHILIGGAWGEGDEFDEESSEDSTTINETTDVDVTADATPTFEPTADPAASTTATPSTAKPTRSPDTTHAPTMKPTRSPDTTHAPTAKPSRSPDSTHAPSPNPTMVFDDDWYRRERNRRRLASSNKAPSSSSSSSKVVPKSKSSSTSAKSSSTVSSSKKGTSVSADVPSLSPSLAPSGSSHGGSVAAGATLSTGMFAPSSAGIVQEKGLVAPQAFSINTVNTELSSPTVGFTAPTVTVNSAPTVTDNSVPTVNVFQSPTVVSSPSVPTGVFSQPVSFGGVTSSPTTQQPVVPTKKPNPEPSYAPAEVEPTQSPTWDAEIITPTSAVYVDVVPTVDFVSSSDDSVIGFLQGNKKLLLFKMLWRMGWTRCPETCTDDATCACSVPQEYLDTYGAKYMLETSGVLTAASQFISSDASDEDYEEILSVIEDPGVAGEMFTSAAPFDPTFWPLHGSIERLLGLKRIRLAKGEISSSDFDETWGYTTNNYLYLVGICDWSGVQSVSDLTVPTCNMSMSAICPGHNENDVLEWEDFLGTGDTYTNAELYTFIHPFNEDLPYAYDDFSYDYCYDYSDDLEF